MTEVSASLSLPPPISDVVVPAGTLTESTEPRPPQRRPGRPTGSKKLKIAIPKDTNETGDASQHMMRLRDFDRPPASASVDVKRPAVAVTEEVPKKRPRGRPPLSSKHKKHIPHTPVSTATPSSGKSTELTVKHVSVASVPAPPRSNTNYLYEDLTPRVLAVLMLSPPLSVEDLHRSVTSVPYICGSSHTFSLEHVQTAAEVLTLSGVVMKVIASANATTLSSSTSTAPTKLYTMKHFARCREAIDIKDMASNIDAQLREAEATQKRIKVLKELHISSAAPAEKLRRLKETVTSSIADDPTLGDNSVYQAVCEALAISY